MYVHNFVPMEFPQWVKECRNGQWGIYCRDIDTFALMGSEAHADKALQGLSEAEAKLNKQLWDETCSPKAIASAARAKAKARRERTFTTSRRRAQA